MSIPDTTPTKSDEYTSFVISASAIAISGGSIESQPVSIIVNSISFSLTL